VQDSTSLGVPSAPGVCGWLQYQQAISPASSAFDRCRMPRQIASGFLWFWGLWAGGTLADYVGLCQCGPCLWSGSSVVPTLLLENPL
jgi:hypothetical protein